MAREPVAVDHDVELKLLETTSYGVERIGRQVGFSSPANFREQFRRLAGVAPQSYRNTFKDRMSG